MELKGNQKRIGLMAVSVIALLFVPAIAMQFTEEVNWGFGDFIVMGVLLTLTFLLIEIVIRIVKGDNAKILLITFIVLLFLLTWAELGVGIFGTPFAGD